MHLLSELDPKVGDTLFCGDLELKVEAISPELEVTCPSGRLWYPKTSYGVHTLARIWTLKPKEKPVEAFVVGDRVSDGKRQGTVSATYTFTPETVCVLWDWGGYDMHRLSSTISKVPKPEPTLADLKLKVGDGVYDTSEEQFGVVDLSNQSYVGVCYGFTRLSIEKSQPATRLKKLEVLK